MGRRKIQIKKIDDPGNSQITYTKRRDGIIKKANELSVLCGADVGLLMFSPTGRLTRFSSEGRIEDIFLRYIEQNDGSEGPIQNEERVYRSLKHSKCEGDMLELISKKESLERKLRELNRLQDEAEEKLRFYQPKVEDITTVREAHVCQQYLTDAIRHLERLDDKLLGKGSESRNPTNYELQAVDTMNSHFGAKESLSSKRQRHENGQDQEESSSTGTHLSIEFLKKRRQWILQIGNVATQTEC